MTVAGPIDAVELGVTLPHEHVLVDFIGADRVSPERYNREEAHRRILPHLERLRARGGRSLVECTPAYLGRDGRLLLELSRTSGLHLVTNTGYYGAGQGKYLPAHALTENADALAERWVREWREGVDGTKIRPGFIKIGVDAGPLTEVNRRIVAAAARTHLATGLTIAGHTGDGQAALEQLDLLAEAGVSARAWIWVHAQSESDAATHLAAARRGAWVEFDGLAPTTVDQHVQAVAAMARGGFLEQTLISHDAGWYSVGEPRGGDYRGYETLFTDFLPALTKAGLSDEEVHTLTVANPARAFSIGVRRS